MKREYVLSVDDSLFSPVGAVRRNNKQPSVSALRHTVRPRHATVWCLQGLLGIFGINSQSHAFKEFVDSPFLLVEQLTPFAYISKAEFVKQGFIEKK